MHLSQLTIRSKHILIECAELDETHEQYFNVNCLQVLFEKVQPHLILSFLKDIGLFNRFKFLMLNYIDVQCYYLCVTCVTCYM